MESVKNHNEEGTQAKDTLNAKKADRATLGKVEADKVDRWIKQINESTKGFLTLTKSDVVNFIIRQHRDDLTPKDLLQLRSDSYDPIRHINWITPQIKSALSDGDAARVKDLQAELRGIELAVINKASKSGDTIDKPKRISKRRSKIHVAGSDSPSLEFLDEKNDAKI